MIVENRFITLSNNIRFHTQIREIDAPQWIILVHGLGEHLGRHNYILKLFPDRFNIFQFDLRGHGKSEGERTLIQNFDDFAFDLLEMIRYLIKTYKMKRYILLGHSMGGAVVSNLIQRIITKAEDIFYPEKVFLSSPLLVPHNYIGRFFIYFPFITKNIAKLPLSIPLKGMINLNNLSHDGRIYEEFILDKLNSSSIQTKLFFEMLLSLSEIFKRPLNIKCPLAVSVGEQDKIVNVKAILNYFGKIEKSAQLKVIKDGFHEMHLDVERIRLEYFSYLKDFCSND